ncbi:hypothetical protein [Streptomyces sp. URMC 129]|uniref:hypothetical protein n=1 Tax=Streptomyces sp. URMC 129 TaxID=3423407 RepID=UPI003F1AE606
MPQPARWSLHPNEQRALHDLIGRHGADALVALAAERTHHGAPAKPARYWLAVWRDLDHRPAAGADVVPLHGYRRPGAPMDHREALRQALAMDAPPHSDPATGGAR